jgi:hypothetical protein
LKSKKLVMMALTVGVLMLTLSLVGAVAANTEPPYTVHQTVSGWGRVGRTRGCATLSVLFGKDGTPHEGKKAILLTVDGESYVWEITNVRQCRNSLIVHAKPLKGHPIEAGPGWLVMRVGMHGSDCAWVIAAGRRTFFIGS